MATAGRSAMSAWEPAREPSPRAPHSRRPPDEQHLGRPRGGRVRVTRTPRRDPRIRPGQACGAAPRPHGSRGGRQGPQVSAAEQHDAPAPPAGAPALQEVEAGHSRAGRKIGAGPCRPGDATANRARQETGPVDGFAHASGAPWNRPGRQRGAPPRRAATATQRTAGPSRPGSIRSTSAAASGASACRTPQDAETVGEFAERIRPVSAQRASAAAARGPRETERAQKACPASEFTRPHASARPMQPARATPRDAGHAVGTALTHPQGARRRRGCDAGPSRPGNAPTNRAHPGGRPRNRPAARRVSVRGRVASGVSRAFPGPAGGRRRSRARCRRRSRSSTPRVRGRSPLRCGRRSSTT